MRRAHDVALYTKDNLLADRIDKHGLQPIAVLIQPLRGQRRKELEHIEDWALLLPARTLIVTAESTKRPIREIVELLEEANPAWRFERVPEGGHMAPVTRPDLINPLIAEFLEEKL